MFIIVIIIIIIIIIIISSSSSSSSSSSRISHSVKQCDVYKSKWSALVDERVKIEQTFRAYGTITIQDRRTFTIRLLLLPHQGRPT